MVTKMHGVRYVTIGTKKMNAIVTLAEQKGSSNVAHGLFTRTLDINDKDFHRRRHFKSKFWIKRVTESTTKMNKSISKSTTTTGGKVSSEVDAIHRTSTSTLSRRLQYKAANAIDESLMYTALDEHEKTFQPVFEKEKKNPPKPESILHPNEGPSITFNRGGQTCGSNARGQVCLIEYNEHKRNPPH
jgi:hypothetical protein